MSKKFEQKERGERKILSRVSPLFTSFNLAPWCILFSLAVVGDSLSPATVGGEFDVVLVSNPSCPPFVLFSLCGASRFNGVRSPDLLEIQGVLVSREHWRGRDD